MRGEYGKTRAFTLVELMVVVLIVGILAAVAIPMYKGRVDMSKWSEAKTAVGTIATAIRAYCAEKGHGCTIPTGALASSESATTTTGEALGINAADLHGTYFAATSYSIVSANSDATTGAITYTVRVTPTAGGSGGTVSNTTARDLDQDGNWTWN
jgi:prepilin-type N-terminal cleavage/methylation domain-containing protein